MAAPAQKRLNRAAAPSPPAQVIDAWHPDMARRWRQWRFLRAARLQFKPQWRMACHLHPRCNELIVIVKGAVRTQMEGRSWSASAGEALNYPANIAHEEASVAAAGLSMICIAYLDGRGDRAADLPRHIVDRRGRVAMLAHWLADLSSQAPAAAEGRDHSEADVVLAALLHECRRGSHALLDDRIERLQRFIDSHFADALSLQDMTRLSGLSRFHLCRLFKQQVGLSPMAYVRQRRVEAAKLMLMTSRTSLRRIAAAVGFGDEFHLSKVFKAVAGRSPSRWRGADRGTPQFDQTL